MNEGENKFETGTRADFREIKQTNKQIQILLANSSAFCGWLILNSQSGTFYKKITSIRCKYTFNLKNDISIISNVSNRYYYRSHHTGSGLCWVLGGPTEIEVMEP